MIGRILQTQKSEVPRAQWDNLQAAHQALSSLPERVLKPLDRLSTFCEVPVSDLGGRLEKRDVIASGSVDDAKQALRSIDEQLEITATAIQASLGRL
jgi:hypothetical protein